MSRFIIILLGLSYCGVTQKVNRIHLKEINTSMGELSKNIGKSINTMSNELDDRIYPNLRLGFFSSDRVGGKGGYDIYYWKL